MAFSPAAAYRNFKKRSFPEKLVLITAASMFLPYFLCSLFVVFCAFYAVFKKGVMKDVLRLSGARFLLFLPLFSALVSVIRGNYLGTAGSGALLIILLCGLYFRSVMTRELFESVIKLVCAMSVVSFVVAAYQMIIIRTGHWDAYHSLYFLFHREYFEEITRDYYQIYRSVSTFFNANYFAAVSSFVALISVFKLIQDKRERLFYACIFVINILNLVLAGSRTAIIALAAGVVLLFIGFKLYRALAGAGGLIVLAGVVFAIFPHLMPRFDSFVSTANTRYVIWQGALKMLRAPATLIFGEGMWAYHFNSSLNHGSFLPEVHSHNIYLEFLLCFGIVGTILIVAYIILTARVSFRDKSAENKSFKVLLLSFGGLILVSGITDATIFGLETSVFMMTVFSAVGIYDKREAGILPDKDKKFS